MTRPEQLCYKTSAELYPQSEARSSVTLPGFTRLAERQTHLSTLAERLAAGPSPKAKGCVLIRAIADHEDYEAIRAAAESDEWGHKALAELLADNELAVTADRIRKHRGGECGCSR